MDKFERLLAKMAWSAYRMYRRNGRRPSDIAIEIMAKYPTTAEFIDKHEEYAR